MPDMLVKLYELPSWEEKAKKLTEKGIKVRRAIPPEKAKILDCIEDKFQKAWRSEADVAFSKSPLNKPKPFSTFI